MFQQQQLLNKQQQQLNKKQQELNAQQQKLIQQQQQVKAILHFESVVEFKPDEPLNVHELVDNFKKKTGPSWRDSLRIALVENHLLKMKIHKTKNLLDDSN